MLSVTQRFEFSAAHRIHGHNGNEGAVHGHNFIAEVTIQSRSTLDSLGHWDINTRILKWIEEYWDHTTILHKEDPLMRAMLPSDGRSWNRYIASCQQAPGLGKQSIESYGKIIQLDDTPIWGPKRPYVMIANPTAENMAYELAWNCGKLLTEPILITCVRLYETPNCWADYVDVKNMNLIAELEENE